MKHDLRITIALLLLFLVSQIVGLGILAQDIDIVQGPAGEINVTHGDTSLGERPETKGFDSFVLVVISVLIGTGLLLIIIRFGKTNWWKALFFFAVFMTISVALGVFLDYTIAYAAALALAILKVYRQNIYIHNSTEVLMYAGIAVLFVPMFTIEWIVALLIVISVYDFIAVFKSKHMVTMAKFQTESRVFSGFSIPYVSKRAKPIKKSVKEIVEKKGVVTEAILGGGDIAFPLLFAGVVLEGLISSARLPLEIAFLKVLIIPVAVTVMLLILFAKAKQGKFYPAMPFLTAGCLIGLGIVWLV